MRISSSSHANQRSNRLDLRAIQLGSQLDGRLERNVSTPLVETILSRVLFRNMSSEENVPTDRGHDEAAGAAGAAGQDTSPGERPRGPAPRDPRAPRYQVNDAAVMRALAHPVRWALLEALDHAGTLTATQAGDILGETPANCAFHLRTLAKYGLVEEAGGGKGRERPWRRAVSGLTMTTTHEDPQTAAAAELLHEVWLNSALDRARGALLAPPGLPGGLHEELGSSQSLRYVTPAEGKQLQADLMAVVDRFLERNDNPALRPPDALPIEWLLLSYPVRDLLSRPGPGRDPDPDPDSDSD
jgi:hypothetical protein